MNERACVLCGTTAKPDRYSCHECGAAVVEFARPDGTGPASTWAPAPEGAVLLAPVAVEARPARPPVAAYLMSGVLLVALVAVAAFGWNAYSNRAASVPKDLRGYASGNGDIYSVRGFSVRLPYHYTTSSLDVPWNGRTISMTAATAVTGKTTVIVASGVVDDALASQIERGAPDVAASVARKVLPGGSTVSTRRVETKSGSGYDIVVKSQDGPDVAVRLLLASRRVVAMMVVSEKSAEGGMRAVADSYQAA